MEASGWAPHVGATIGVCKRSFDTFTMRVLKVFMPRVIPLGCEEANMTWLNSADERDGNRGDYPAIDARANVGAVITNSSAPQDRRNPDDWSAGP
jgi:hypothetical protein